jgi:hypothetical protein
MARRTKALAMIFFDKPAGLFYENSEFHSKIKPNSIMTDTHNKVVCAQSFGN